MGIVLLWVVLGLIAAAVIVAVVRTVRASARGRARAAGPRTAAEEPAAKEAKRQAALDSLGLLDTPPEDRFDRIVTMARQLYNTDSAIFSVIDRDREWHKSKSGSDSVEIARNTSFCSVTIRGEGAMVVGNAANDDRFKNVPAVVDAPSVRFYAGFPVLAPSGEAIGALCVFDSTPRDPETVDETMLAQLAHLIEAELKVKPVDSGRRR